MRKLDCGDDVRRNRKTPAIAKLSDTVQGMMAQWTEDNFGMFQDTMELIRKNAPIQWSRLYMEAVKLGIVRESNINININRQKDHDDLQALVRTRISPTLTANATTTYTPYEEVPATPAEAAPLPTSPLPLP